MEMTLFAITPNDTLAKILFSVPVTLFSVVPEVLVPKEEIISNQETKLIPLNKKLRLPSGHLWPLKPLNQQTGEFYAGWVG